MNGIIFDENTFLRLFFVNLKKRLSEKVNSTYKSKFHTED